MANTNYEFIYTVEDYSGITTSVVMADGQSRWFDTVTGFDASEVVQLIGDGTSTIAALLIAKIDNTVPGDKELSGSIALTGDYDVIDTDSASVAATTPTSPVDGQIWTVINSGTSGNHVTGLPGTISLGDGKRISFIYDNTNSLWRYEDVIIDEYVSSGQTVTKWSGGLMKIRGYSSSTASNPVAITSAESFIDTTYYIGGMLFTTTARSLTFGANTVSTINFYRWNSAAGTAATSSFSWFIDGRWKTGV